MDNPLKTPEQLLPYRTLKEILADRGGGVHAVGPTDTVLSALQSMAEKHIGFLVVLDDGKLLGVLSERDYARKVVLAGRASHDTLVGDLMTREVVTVSPGDRFGDCMRLLDQHAIRHLPVVESGKVVGVISIRDLLAELVTHHERVIMALERERMTMLQSTA
ncbi:MAG: CBS domain-containing protein [Candidatus Accumulibacter sp.]|uniref:CBS domain-containing protein n=1 Tax=Candidatus Accumulibacter affinis TaxID=2954384 RepID=A0A935TJD7_9PROT|nr:CBS domain-containing protein [Candidatus Accumulibacter affinis]